MSPKLTIQIVGWNSAEHLPATVAALQTIPTGEASIRYLDNGSTDNSIEIVLSRLPHADIIELGENKGFASAHNIGFSKCTTPFVLTHDPDVELNWKGLQKILQYIETNPQVGAVQGKLVRKEENIIDSAGIVLTSTLNGKERGAGEEDSGQYDKQAQINAVTGACGLYRMQALKIIAHSAQEIFDNDFFAYKEDVDVGWRLKRAGFTSMYLPALMGRHRRTLGRRGKLPWFMNPKKIRARLKSRRTHYSLRNYIWMLAKNMSFKDALLHTWFIIPRLIYWLLLSIAYPPLFKAWLEALQKLPTMLRKRLIVSSANEAINS